MLRSASSPESLPLSLRALYCILTTIFRRAKVDTVLPLSEAIHGVDGSAITSIPIPRGTTVLLNVRACNTNKALWGEDALEWKPERWLGPLPRAVEEARVPGIYANLYVYECLTPLDVRATDSELHSRMTFLGGGHACM